MVDAFRFEAHQRPGFGEHRRERGAPDRSVRERHELLGDGRSQPPGMTQADRHRGGAAGSARPPHDSIPVQVRPPGANQHQDVDGPDQAREVVVQLRGVGAHEHELVLDRESVDRRPEAVNRNAGLPELASREAVRVIAPGCEAPMHLDREVRDRGMIEYGVVRMLAVGRPDDTPAGPQHRAHGKVELVPWEDEIDVVHRTEPRLRIAHREARALHDERLEAGVAQRFDGLGQRRRQEQRAAAAVKVEVVANQVVHPAQVRPALRRAQRRPQQGAGLVVVREPAGGGDVGTAVDQVDDRRSVGPRVRCLPQQSRGGRGRPLTLRVHGDRHGVADPSDGIRTSSAAASATNTSPGGSSVAADRRRRATSVARSAHTANR